jgi:hypothetical protein
VDDPKASGPDAAIAASGARDLDLLGGKIKSIATPRRQLFQAPTRAAINSGRLVRFPPRRSAAIRIIREDDGWLVLTGAHGWLHGDAKSARSDAQWLAQNLSLPVRETAP